ncbi:hypothetical protein EYF80_067890 [Liparis tanakae]|uniref:Uncharacterized protein n=1 Tax=Liparis tanakae TaxID=230148 RepID=A0A4Z2DZV4_9TELE|nr:hypothetical protein EYF80_067890 [Liparis tanakae]
MQGRRCELLLPYLECEHCQPRLTVRGASPQQQAPCEVQLGPYGGLQSKVAWEIATYCKSRNADKSQVPTVACAHLCIHECFITTRLLQEI